MQSLVGILGCCALLIADLPLIIRFRLGFRQIQVAGFYILIAAVVALAVAGIIWAIQWVTKNARIQ